MSTSVREGIKNLNVLTLVGESIKARKCRPWRVGLISLPRSLELPVAKVGVSRLTMEKASTFPGKSLATEVWISHGVQTYMGDTCCHGCSQQVFFKPVAMGSHIPHNSRWVFVRVLAFGLRPASREHLEQL